jgi:hypothetical protein
MQILKNKRREYSITIFPFFSLKKDQNLKNKKIDIFGGHVSQDLT